MKHKAHSIRPQTPGLRPQVTGARCREPDAGCRKLAFILFAVFFPLFAFGDVSVDLAVPRTQIGPDEGLVYRVQIESTDKTSQGDIQLMLPDSLKKQGVEVSGPSVSSSFSFEMTGTNVKKSHNLGYEYILSFQRPGTYKLKNIKVKLGKKTYALREVTVQVDDQYARKTAPPSQGRRNLDPFGLFRKLFPTEGDSFFSRHRPKVVRPPRESDVKIVFQPSSTKVIEGEPIWVKIYAYVHQNYRLHMISPHFDLAPKSIFWREDLDVQKPRVLRQTGEGNMVVHLIDEFVLFPLRTGVEQLEGAELSLTLTDGIRSYPVTVQADPVTVTVQPLPDPKPPIPLVSDYLETRIKLDTSKPLETDQPLPFEYEVTGLANLRQIDQFPIKSNWEIDVVVQEDVFETLKQPNRFRLRKKGLLIFRNPGEYHISLSPITYYDPVRQTYQETDTQSWTLKVEQGSAASPLAQVDPVKKTPRSGLAEGGKGEKLGIPFWIWWGLSGLGVFLLLLWGWLWSQKQARLSNQVLQTEQQKETSHETFSTLSDELRDVISKSDGDPTEVLQFLSKRGLLNGSAGREVAGILGNPVYKPLLDQYQALKYSGKSIQFGQNDRQLAIQMAEEIVKIVVKP